MEDFFFVEENKSQEKNDIDYEKLNEQLKILQLEIDNFTENIFTNQKYEEKKEINNNEIIIEKFLNQYNQIYSLIKSIQIDLNFMKKENNQNYLNNFLNHLENNIDQILKLLENHKKFLLSNNIIAFMKNEKENDNQNNNNQLKSSIKLTNNINEKKEISIKIIQKFFRHQKILKKFRNLGFIE